MAIHFDISKAGPSHLYLSFWKFNAKENTWENEKTRHVMEPWISGALIFSMALSPDGNILVANSNYSPATLVLIDLKTCRPIAALERPEIPEEQTEAGQEKLRKRLFDIELSSPVFSPDGKHLFVGDNTGRVFKYSTEIPVKK